MKDIRIKWKWIKRELIIILLMYVFANLINIASIIIYKTSWGEVFSSQGYVLFLTEWLYITGVIVRLIYYGVKYLFKKNKS